MFVNQPMLQFKIPAKTFLLGEYTVLLGSDALILTTSPYFHMTLVPMPYGSAEQSIFHPESPAGQLFLEKACFFEGWRMVFSDPFRGLGGMGRSSAEFIAVWWAAHYLESLEFTIQLKQIYLDYLNLYQKGSGIFRPSGVDVLAQCVGGGLLHLTCHKNTRGSVLSWPFKQMEVLLFHTQTHCSTAQHVSALSEIPDALMAPVQAGLDAFQSADQTKFLSAIQAFVKAQAAAGLIADYSLSLMERIQTLPGVLAVKGCGAMGADVILVCCELKAAASLMAEGFKMGLLPITTYSNQVSGAEVSQIARSEQRQVI